MLLDGAAHDALAWAPWPAPPLPQQRRFVAGGGAEVPQSKRPPAPRLLPLRARAHFQAGWCGVLINLFHTSGTQDPCLRLICRIRAKQDAHTGLWVTPDGLHHHVGGNLSSPTQAAAYSPPAALMYILRDVLVVSEHQAPNADVAWPELLRL